MLLASRVGLLRRPAHHHQPTAIAAAAGRRLFAATTTTTTTTSPRVVRTLSSPQKTAAKNKRFTSSAAAVTSTKPLVSSSSTKTERRKNVALGVMGGILLAGLHSATGSQNDFFDYRFTANKSPDDLATFYGGEDFMELFCIFPFVGQLMMRNGAFDEQGNVITTGIPGTLRVSMVFSDDTTNDTGEIEWFNKRERFRNVCLGWTCWDMVINFGFRTREDDGSIEVYHYGEYFHGNLPIVSQIMMLVFKCHARWLAWATEHHINHYAFTAETEEEEEFEDESRRNMPFLLKNYARSDLMAMLFGKEVDKPSFLLKKPNLNTDGGDRTGEVTAQERILPIQREATKFQISQDIASDRLTAKRMLTSSNNNNAAQETEAQQQGSIMKSNAYGAATEAAQLRRLTRAATRRNIAVEGDGAAAEAAVASEQQRHLLPIQQKATKVQISEDIATDRRLTIHQNSTPGDDDRQQQEAGAVQQQQGIKTSSSVYGAATGAARLRHLTRAATTARQKTGHAGGATSEQ